MKYTKLAWTVVMTAFAVSLGAAPAAAKVGGGNAKAKPPKPAAAVKAKPTAMPKAKAQTPKVKANGATKATKAKTSGPTLTSANRAERQAPSSANTQSTDRAPDPTARLNKAQQLLVKNDNLRMKVQTRLGGADPIVAASGFRNLGQFVAAVNASYNNPGVPFKSLKALMTGPSQMSLGQALKQLRGVDLATANTTANTAMAQADADILAAR